MGTTDEPTDDPADSTHESEASTGESADSNGERREPHPILTDLRRAEGGSTRTRFTTGFSLSYRAFAFLKDRPGLWPYVVVPAAINATLFVVAVVLLALNAERAVGWVWSAPAVEAWYDWLFRLLWYLLLALAVALSVGVSYVLTLLVGGLIAGPFRDALSTRAERILLGTDDLPGDEGSFVVDTVTGVLSDLLVIAAYCAVMLPVVLLNLVPAVGSVVSTLLGSLVSAFFLAFEFSNDPLGRRGRGLRERFGLLRERRATAFGFGFGTTLMLWVPLLNFLTIPLAVVGGTALGIALDESAGGGAVPPVEPGPGNEDPPVEPGPAGEDPPVEPGPAGEDPASGGSSDDGDPAIERRPDDAGSG
ncbi:hypothetical protein BRD00_11000 [Halobacteriales archaeon QS_8_69_26]|nr:MAG: hypothetical protein BRD00_11000 [Halobacteriales archaeon QS_8_69_26]